MLSHRERGENSWSQGQRADRVLGERRTEASSRKVRTSLNCGAVWKYKQELAKIACEVTVQRCKNRIECLFIAGINAFPRDTQSLGCLRMEQEAPLPLVLIT